MRLSPYTWRNLHYSPMSLLDTAHQLNYPQLTRIYEDLHAHPELSGHEHTTAEKILAELRSIDATIHSSIGGYGIVVVLDNGEGNTALMRADFDALPVEEKTGVSFASTVPGKMHACGHDMHTTSLIAVVHHLDNNRHLWRGTFIALFQPSEENGQGALAMVNDNLFAHIPMPDVCFGQHILPGRAGSIMSMPGPIMAACDAIEIIITGKAAHGSMPHNSLDPTYAAAAIVLRLQGIVGREVAPSDFAVISVGTFEAGNSHNTIPGQARIVLNLRTYDEKVRAHLYEAIERVVRAECAASNFTTPPSFRYFGQGPVTDNSHEVFNIVRPLFDAHFCSHSLDATPWTASEDFSYIPRAKDIPYMFWFVGSTPHELWDKAVAEDRVHELVPVNHMSTFLPDFRNTLDGCVHATLAALEGYLGTKD